MFYTKQLKAHQTKTNGERKYSITFYELNKETNVYEHVRVACVNSYGAHLAIKFDITTNEFILDTITPM